MPRFFVQCEYMFLALQEVLDSTIPPLFFLPLFVRDELSLLPIENAIVVVPSLPQIAMEAFVTPCLP